MVTVALMQWAEGLDDEIAGRLRAGGWFEWREFPIDRVRSSLEGHGYQVHELATSVLESTHGLTARGIGERVLKFDAAEAASLVEDEAVEYVKMNFSDSACPVAHGALSICFISADGVWWVLDQEWVCYFRLNSFNAALRLMVLGDREDVEMVYPRGEVLPPGYRDAEC